MCTMVGLRRRLGDRNKALKFKNGQLLTRPCDRVCDTVDDHSTDSIRKPNRRQ